ncbi:MAG: AAA family ATPase [Clostridia bacterium]|nr:AAA family ATPase [Clostridia bacterium]
MDTRSLPAHPDAAAEQTHLTQTLAVIACETHKLERLTGVGAEEEALVAARDDLTDPEVAASILRMQLDALHRLSLAKHQAYFARLDFIPEGGEKEIRYIGRWGVHPIGSAEPAVVDWRSPVANLYYSGQVGAMDYEAPDGRIRGEMTLKRMLTVRDERLESMFDSGVAAQDAYLQEVLGTVSSDRLKEIVTTIQAEQNVVIRHPFDTSLIVQGAAGSGKTTIALHRISWLLYAQRDTLRPEQVMILAPNPLFLSYISAVLPDLGVERVAQTTFAALCAGWMGRRAPKLQLFSRLEDRLCGLETADNAQVLRRKGSLDYLAAIDAFLDRTQETVMPQDGLSFGGHELFSHDRLQDIFLRQLSPFPWALRLPELRKYVKPRLDKLCEAMKHQLDAMAQERLTRLLSALPDGEERRARARKLLSSRDERMAEIDQRQKQFLKELPGLFPDLSPMALYRQFLDTEDEALRAATLPYLDRGEARAEDLAALAEITRRVWGIRGAHIRHVVIDECQDFSPAQLAVLRQVWPTASFTLVGDLMQGVNAAEGTDSYEQWLQPVFGGKAEIRSLAVSYRSTTEIMSLAGQIAACHPIPGLPDSRPVLRHGPAPVLRTFAHTRERIAALRDQLLAWQAEGFHSMAVICKTRSEAAALYRSLKKELPVRLPRAEDSDYTGGMLILSASMVKGLEFDCVVLADASETLFPSDPFLCRVLYVMCTRPLHRLSVFASGSLSPMLPGADEKEKNLPGLP